MTDEERKKLTKTRISRAMKTRMFELNMNTTRLAEKCGIGRRQLCGYLNRKNGMNADTLLKIAEALGCSTDWMLGMSSKKTRE